MSFNTLLGLQPKPADLEKDMGRSILNVIAQYLQTVSVRENYFLLWLED